MTSAQRNRKNRQLRLKSRARRAANKAAGLRCDGQPLSPRRPCGCIRGCLKCGGRGLPAEKIAAMWEEFQAGASMSAIERRHGIGRGSFRQMMGRRGIVVPHKPGQPKRDPRTGRVIPLKPATDAQITAAIRKLKRVIVPPELKQEWKKQSIQWQRDLIRRIRDHVGVGGWRPTTPFSDNVKPFDYFTPEARRIVAALNVGRTSQTKLAHLRPCTEGIIYQGRLWFWMHRNDGRAAAAHYVEMGRAPRRLLHRAIYEQHHGPIPAQHTVIFKDGNRNNFAPENLVLRSMADCARMNCGHSRLKGAARKAFFEKIATSRARNFANKARAATAALLQGSPFTQALSRS